jgi:Spy/CpxP family protein refolding chaperone
MKHKQFFLGLCLVALVSMFSFGFAGTDDATVQNPQRRDRTQFRKSLIERLNLTDDQKKQMEKMHFENQKKMVAVDAKIKTAGIELRELLSADKLDKVATEKKLTELSKYRVEKQMNHINNWSAVNEILTPEQQKIWKEALKRPMQGRQGMPGGPMQGRPMMRQRMMEREMQGQPPMDEKK